MIARRFGIAFGIVCMATLLGVAALHIAPASWTSGRSLVWGAAGRKKPSTFDKPRCVSIAPDGSVYCLDLTGRIQHFTKDGEYLNEMQMPDVSIGRPQGMDIDEAGNVYVADTHYFQVVKFSPQGEIVLRFGEKGTAPGQFFWPCAIAVDKDGTILTAEYGSEHDRIQRWSATGELLAHWGTFGIEPGNFMRPMGIAIDSKSNVYVADAANHRVQVFSRNGDLLRVWGRKGVAPGEFNYPYDIAIDAEDRVYTVEYAGHRIQRFDADGRLLGMWGSLGSTPDSLSHPWGLDVTADGIVYVADTMNYRVLRTVLPYSSADSSTNASLVRAESSIGGTRDRGSIQ